MDQKAKIFFRKFLAGLILGVGAILPGVSGGILAVSMGLYRKMLEAIYTFFKKPKENFLYLFPIGLGGLVGFIAVAQLLGVMMGAYRMPVMYLFIGMVLGGAPALYQEGIKGTGFQPRYLIATIAGMLLIGLLSLFEKGGVLFDLQLNFFTGMLSGGIIAVGVIVPGVSTAFMLMFLGLYDEMLLVINQFDAMRAFPVGLGMVLVAVLLIKGVRAVFDSKPHYAYFCVLGFLCASVALIFPGLGAGLENVLYLVLLIGGFFATYLIERAMEQV